MAANVVSEKLEKNDFTEFMVMREEDADRPSVRGATAEMHFYRTV